MPAVETCDSVGRLIEKAHDAQVRRVLLTDYATVEPKRENGAVYLTGMITLVVTAFDRVKSVIYRWHEKTDAKQMVSIQAGSGRGINQERSVVSKKLQILQVLREEGFDVDDGEWTPQSADAYLESRRTFMVG